ncbi:MAG: hypothetical protein M1275_03270 [Patescibacteria group bacterium]|nr:hypothetical protein [Patescibacteria group bacterium]
MAKKTTKKDKLTPASGATPEASEQTDELNLDDVPSEATEETTLPAIEDSPEKEDLQNLSEQDVPSYSVDKQVEGAVVPAKVHPPIRAGICEFCGIPFEQCKHYKGLPMKCSYCPAGEDDKLFRSRVLNVYELFDKPGHDHR